MKKIDIDLLDFRLKNNDPYVKSKVKKCKILAIILALFLLILIINPLHKLKEEFHYKMAHPKVVKLYPVKNAQADANGKYNTKYIYPTDGIVTSEYGYRTDPITGGDSFHTGIDISCYNHHDNILAVANGTVTFAGSQEGYGYCVEIRHDFENETIYSFYAHLSSVHVSEGQQVLQGEVIGNEGGDPNSDPNPGYSTGHHLHFELRNASGYGNDIEPNLGL
ncbi:MAG: M23 family metallopeptidase [Clostridia bacterium]|nr:M23 family metallopeptidase [Clostridia bacterium]